MSVKKSVLEAKTDRELEEYIVEGNRFVPEANILAFEILKTRGRAFTEKETERIMFLKAEKNKVKEDVIIHSNYIKAANVIYISTALGVVNLFLSPEIYYNSFGIIVSIISLAIIAGIAYLISKGNKYAKYLFIIIFLLGLISIPSIYINFMINPIVGSINVIQTILQIYAIYLLITTSKDKLKITA